MGGEGDAEMAVENEEEEEEYEVEEVADDVPMHVLDRVFLGSIDAARNLAALKRANVGISLGLLGVADERVATDNEDGILRVLVELEDSFDEKLFERLPALIATMEDAVSHARGLDCNLLVHCIAGRSRSPSLVAAWLVATRQFTLTAAIDHIQMVRPWIDINSHFQSDLKLFDQVIHFKARVPPAENWLGAVSLRQSHLPRLDFGANLISDILSKKKTVTMRLTTDTIDDANSDLKHIYRYATVAATSASGEVNSVRKIFALLRVDRVAKNVTLSEIDSQTLERTGLVSTVEVLSVLKKFYPDVTMQTPLILLHFSLLEK